MAEAPTQPVPPKTPVQQAQENIAGINTVLELQAFCWRNIQKSNEYRKEIPICDANVREAQKKIEELEASA